MSDIEKRIELVRTVREVGLAAVVALILVFNMTPALNRLGDKVDRLCELVQFQLAKGGVK